MVFANYNMFLCLDSQTSVLCNTVGNGNRTTLTGISMSTSDNKQATGAPIRNRQCPLNVFEKGMFKTRISILICCIKFIICLR